MKLVDILARELRVWPGSRVAAITQSCIDTELYGENHYGEVIWREYLTLAECNPNGLGDNRQRVTEDQWQAAVDALKAEKVPAWVGIGLPPVGAVCEWRDDEAGCWQVVEIMYLSGVTALLRFPDYPGDCEGAYSPSNCQFRPIRTPE